MWLSSGEVSQPIIIVSHLFPIASKASTNPTTFRAILLYPSNSRATSTIELRGRGGRLAVRGGSAIRATMKVFARRQLSAGTVTPNAILDWSVALVREGIEFGGEAAGVLG